MLHSVLMIRVTNYYMCFLSKGKFNTQTYVNAMGWVLHMYWNKLHQSRICIMRVYSKPLTDEKWCHVVRFSTV